MSVIVEYLQPVLKLWILYCAGKVFFVEYALQKKEFYVSRGKKSKNFKSIFSDTLKEKNLSVKSTFWNTSLIS